MKVQEMKMTDENVFQFAEQPLPSTRIPIKEQLRKESFEDEKGTIGTSQFLKKSLYYDWTLPQFFHKQFSNNYAPDPNFKYTKSLFDEVTKGVPMEYWDVFDEASSHAQVYQIRNDLLERVEQEKLLSSWGATGAGVRVVSTLLDPVVWGSAIAAGSFIPKGLSSASRIQRIIKMSAATGAIGAVEAGAYGALQAYGDPIINEDDIKNYIGWGAGIGGGIGGLVGAITKNKSAITRIKEAGGELSEEGQLLQKQIDEFDPASPQIDKDNPNRFKSTDPIEEGPAPKRSKLKNEADELVYESLEDTPWNVLTQSALESYGPSVRFGSSTNPLIRFIGRKIFANASADLTAKGVPVRGIRSAEEKIRVEANKQIKNLREFEIDVLKQHHRNAGTSFGRKFTGAADEEIFEQVTTLIRSGNVDAAAEGVVKTIAKRHIQYYKEMLDFAKKNGIKGFDEIAENQMYVPRLYSLRKTDKLLSKLKQGEFTKLIRSSLMVDGLTSTQLNAIAKAFSRKIMTASDNMGFGNPSVLSSDAIDDLRLSLKELLEDDALAETIADTLEKQYRSKNPQADRISRAKSRLPLDETKKVKLTYKDGTVVEHTIEDLLENNARLLQQRYNRSIYGAAAMRNILDELSTKTNRTFDTFADVKSFLRRTASREELNKFDSNLPGLEIGMLEFAERTVIGKPISPTPTSGTGKFLKESAGLARDFNFWRIGGSFGVASIPETAYLLTDSTLRSFVNNMPVLNKIFGDAAKGRLSKELAKELYFLTGQGFDRLTMQFAGRVDEMGVFENTAMNFAGFRQNLSRSIADFSGLNFLTKFQQEGMARMSFMKILDDIVTNPNNRKISNIRLAQLGLDDNLMRRVAKILRKENVPVLNKKGMGRVMDQDAAFKALMKSDDQEAVSAFLVSIQKNAESTIQRTYMGDIPMFLSTEMGKLMGQFRTYQLTAYNRQLIPGMQRLQHGDRSVLNNWIGLMFLGSMTYTIQTYLNTINDPEKREKYLTPSQIIKGGFVRAGFSTFIPGAVDTLGYAFDEQPFSTSRASGLASDFFSGIPSVQLINDTARAVKGPLSSLLKSDYDFSEKDANAIKRLVPYSRVPIIKQGIEATINSIGLPEKSKGN